MGRAGDAGVERRDAADAGDALLEVAAAGVARRAADLATDDATELVAGQLGERLLLEAEGLTRKPMAPDIAKKTRVRHDR